MVSHKLFDNLGTESGHNQSREHAHSGNDTLDTGEKDLKESNIDVMALKPLLTDYGAITVSHLRWVFSSFQILIFTLFVKAARMINQ